MQFHTVKQQKWDMNLGGQGAESILLTSTCCGHSFVHSHWCVLLPGLGAGDREVTKIGSLSSGGKQIWNAIISMQWEGCKMAGGREASGSREGPPDEESGREMSD